MHGAGTVKGAQLVADMASKTCCARVAEMQPQQYHHHHGHHGQRQRRIGHGSLSSSGLGKGGRGPSGPGIKARTSMMLCVSSSVRMMVPALRMASRSRASNSAKSGEP